LGEGAVGLLKGVVYVGDADSVGGGGVRVADCYVEGGEVGPEDVEEGDGARGFGFWKLRSVGGAEKVAGGISGRSAYCLGKVRNS